MFRYANSWYEGTFKPISSLKYNISKIWEKAQNWPGRSRFYDFQVCPLLTSAFGALLIVFFSILYV